MKTTISFFALFAFLVFSNTSCKKNNENPNQGQEISADFLFSSATRSLVDVIHEADDQKNIFNYYAQYWAQSGSPDVSLYSVREVPDYLWLTLYNDVLRNLEEVKTIYENSSSQEQVRQNKIAIVEILQVYTYTTLVDIFGDILFTEVFDADIELPSYDTAKDVYYTCIDQLDNANKSIDVSFPGFANEVDLIYGSDIANWKKFSNALQLKLAMRIADSDPAKAKTMAESAASDLFSSNEDQLAYPYLQNTSHNHPLYDILVVNNSQSFMPANTTIDIMNATNDPRRAFWFDLNGMTDYIGGSYGNFNTYSDLSHLGSVFRDQSLEGMLLSYAELEFLLAEAVERGFAVGGTAESHYNAGITASITYWGGTTDMADTYLAQEAVSYSTANGDWKAKIGTQKWLALYNRGLEGWSTWRLFDLDFFNVPGDLTENDFPNRMPYPEDEVTFNTDNYNVAASRYNNDSPRAKIFWDVN